MLPLLFFTSMVFLTGGVSFIGTSDVDARFPNVSPGLRAMLKTEEPRTIVTVQPFFMDAREVSNEEYLQFTRDHPEFGLKQWSGSADEPVAFVTWYAAKAYCAWQRKRLPTEAEWEYAARGGAPEAEYPWGSAPPSPERANFGQSKIGRPVKTGRYEPNGYGLYDMAGSVWELTADTWRDRHDAPVPSGPGQRKVIKGGSFGADGLQLRVSFRDSHKPDDPVAHVGFRCAR